MRAAQAWLALRRAGVALGDDGGALVLRVPEGLAASPWLALGRASGAHLYPLASGAWRAEVEGWSEAMRDEWDERAALRALGDGLSCDEAERAAYLEVRERALAPHAATLAALERELGAVLVRVDARRPEGGATDDEPSPDRAVDRGPRGRLRARPCPACGQRRADAGACGRCGWRPVPFAGEHASESEGASKAGWPAALRALRVRGGGPAGRSDAPRALRLVAPPGRRTAS